MFECDTFMLTLSKLLFPMLRNMEDWECKIQLDTMRELYMMAVLNVKTARDKCCPPIWDPDMAEFKVGDMVSYTPTSVFDTKYEPSFKTCKWISDKAFDVQDSTEKVRHVYTTSPITTSSWTCINAPTWHDLIWMDDKYINYPYLMPNLHSPGKMQNKQIKGKHHNK